MEGWSAVFPIEKHEFSAGSRDEHGQDWIGVRGESKPERRSGKRIIAGTAFRLEFLVGWYYDADATMAVPELY